jgi:hypothetical protein
MTNGQRGTRKLRLPNVRLLFAIEKHPSRAARQIRPARGSADKRKPSPCGPGSVHRRGGASDTFQRGTAACTSVAYLGGWQQPTAQQHNRSMRFWTQSRNAKGNMSAMRSSQSVAETHFDARRYGRLALCKIVLKKVGCHTILLRQISSRAAFSPVCHKPMWAGAFSILRMSLSENRCPLSGTYARL